MSEVAKPINVEERIRDRVREEFVNLISDEQWNEFIKKTVKGFTEDFSEHGRTRVAPIRVMIREALESECRTVIRDKLNDLRKEVEDGAKNEIERLVREHLPEMMTSLIVSTVHSFMPMLSNQIAMGLKACKCGQILPSRQDGGSVYCYMCGTYQ